MNAEDGYVREEFPCAAGYVGALPLKILIGNL